MPRGTVGGSRNSSEATQRTRPDRPDRPDSRLDAARRRARAYTRTNTRSITRTDTEPASDPTPGRHVNRHRVEHGFARVHDAPTLASGSSRARSLVPLAAVRPKQRLSPRIASPPPARGEAGSIARGVVDAPDHGPRRQRDHVARRERDLHDAVGPNLDHEHAATDRPIGERDDDRGEAGTHGDHPQLGVKVPWPAGSIVPARWYRRSTTSETCARSRSTFAGDCAGGGIVSVHCSPCTGQAA